MIMGLKRRKSNKSGLVGGKRGKWIFFFFFNYERKTKVLFLQVGWEVFFVIRNRRGKFSSVQWKVKKEFFVFLNYVRLPF